MAYQQIILARYVVQDKLLALLARRFPGQRAETSVSIRRGKWIIVTPEPLTQEEIDECAP